MRKKFKMELINNYVDIYKILFNCKEILKSKESDQEKIISVLQDALNLKSEYEKMFEHLNMNDTSFLVLKRDLDNAMKCQPPQAYSPSSMEKILELKGKAEKDLHSLHEQA